MPREILPTTLIDQGTATVIVHEKHNFNVLVIKNMNMVIVYLWIGIDKHAIRKGCYCGTVTPIWIHSTLCRFRSTVGLTALPSCALIHGAPLHKCRLSRTYFTGVAFFYNAFADYCKKCKCSYLNTCLLLSQTTARRFFSLFG